MKIRRADLQLQLHATQHWQKLWQHLLRIQLEARTAQHVRTEDQIP